MKVNKIIFFALGLLAVICSSCAKIEIPNTNIITVNLANNGPAYLTENATLSPGTAIAFHFTVTSPSDMEYVYIQKNGTDISKDQVLTNKTTFTGDKTFTADVAAGVYTYRILAKDKAGIYLGEKKIVVTITSDLHYYTVKTMFVPDTIAKTNPTYYSSSANEVLSYSGVGTKSNTIDFGYFFDPALTGATVNGHTIYALNVSPAPAPIAMYDLSAFTKNATKLKLVTTPTFANVTSSSVLQTAGAGLSSGTSTTIKGLTAGKTVLFQTVTGKIGMMQVNYVNQDNPSKGTYMSIDVKIQK